MNAGFSRMIGTMAALAMLALASASHATTYTSVANGNWANPNTWSPTGVPGSGDTAVIDGEIISITESQTITNLTQASGRLLIDDGGVLTMSGSPPTLVVTTGSQSFPGVVVLPEGRLVTTASMTFSGNGWLGIGADGADGGVLELSGSSTTLTINVSWILNGTIRVSANSVNILSLVGDIGSAGGATTLEIGPNAGSGTVTYVNDDTLVADGGNLFIKKNAVNASGQAVFDNQGLVLADNDGIVFLDASLSGITDTAGSCSTPRWRVAEADSVIWFNSDAGSLTGYFHVGPGTLEIDNCVVQTSGLLKFLTGGTVSVTNDSPDPTMAFFNATGTGGIGSGNHYCSGSNCSSASFPYTASVSCP